MEILHEIPTPWRPYSGEPLIDLMADEWAKIFPTLSSMTEFDAMVSRNRAQVIVAYDAHCQPFAFVLLYRDSSGHIQLHGGAWSGPLIARCHILVVLLDALLRQGSSVRTYVDEGNTAAIRLLRGVGFRLSRRAAGLVFLWLSKASFHRSSIAKRYISFYARKSRR